MSAGIFGQQQPWPWILWLPSTSASPPPTPTVTVYLSDPVTLLAGDSQAYFSARSLFAGTISNSPARVFNRHNFTNYAESRFGSLLVTNDFGIIGGRDQEDDAGIRRAAAPVQTSRPAVFPEEVP